MQIKSLKNKQIYLDCKQKYEQIQNRKKQQEKISQLEDVRKNIAEYKDKKSEMKDELESLIKEQTTVKMLLLRQENSEKKIKILQEKIKATESEETIYKLYKNMISDRSLPKLILKNTISQVELEANKMIYSLAGLMVYIHSDTEDSLEDPGSKWEILIKKDNMTLGSEQVSGYERFIINVGIKLALDKYKFYSGSKIFFIDEAFDCVSEENLDKISQLFDYLKTYYSHILIISHNEELKKKIDHRIDIVTDYSVSSIALTQL